jgi:hypothetical protein
MRVPPNSAGLNDFGIKTYVFVAVRTIQRINGNFRNSVWNDFKCQISPSFVLSNLKTIRINLRRNQNRHRIFVYNCTCTSKRPKPYISHVTTIPYTAGDATLAATPNELHDEI